MNVLVTGGNTGIGRAVSLEFAKKGFNVAVNYVEKPESARKVVEDVKKYSDGMDIKADITDEKQVRIMFEKARKRLGDIDVLVNNAGILNQKEFFRTNKKDWMKVLEINLVGAVLCAREAAKTMLKKKKGKVINISSVRGKGEFTRPGILPYCASKAGMVNFTKGLAKELAPYVNVNAVAPGPTDTRMERGIGEEKREKIIKGTLLKRMARPEEIAKAVFYLASEDADFITGEVLVIDGGLSLG